MERKLRLFQAALLIILGVAIAVLAMALWQLFRGVQRQSPYANARFVQAQMKEVVA